MSLLFLFLAIGLPLLAFTSKLAGRVLGITLGIAIGLLMLGFTALRPSFKAKKPARQR